MMRNFVRRVAIGASLAVVPLSTQAALVCSSEVEHLIFGDISVMDGSPQKTSGKVTVVCSGGIAHTMVQVELTIGSDDGRRRVDGTPRYMADGTAIQLAYAVTSESGGDILERDFELDENGQATTQFTLDAEITSSGSEAIVGSYKSDDFVELMFCETGLTDEAKCNESAPTSSFTVEASVTASCSLSVSDMNFGSISPDVVEAVDQSATISVSCTNASAYTIGLSQGAHFVGSGPTDRRMKNGDNLLAYGLYLDEARSESWGDDAGSVASAVGTGGGQSLSVFGRILSNQEAFTGTYSDTVVVIVSY